MYSHTAKSLIIIIFVLFLSKITYACSVCGGSFSDEEIKAYTIITILLGGTPLILVTVLILWIIRKYKKVS